MLPSLGEVRTATFDQFNLDLAIWTKQAAYTKQRRIHRVPISHEAVALIRLRREIVPKGCPFLFPGDVPDQPVGDPQPGDLDGQGSRQPGLGRAAAWRGNLVQIQ